MTSLQQQLRSIAVAAGLNPASSSGTKSQFIPYPSLLYTPEVAADLHLDQLHGSAVAALATLQRLDPRFGSTTPPANFKKLLFVPPASATRPNACDGEQLAALHDAVDVFCRLLQPHFLRVEAQHALEYLIRVFGIHESCVESLMKCGLAYHESAEFARLVRVARVEGTVFEFLRVRDQRKDANRNANADAGDTALVRVRRNVIVDRMVRDRGLLRFVCEMAKEAGSGEWKVVGDGGGGGVSVMGWYGVVVCEVVGRLAEEDAAGEELVGFLLPYVVKGLGRGVVGGYRDATCMVVGGLSGRVVMREELVDGACRVEILSPRTLRPGLHVHIRSRSRSRTTHTRVTHTNRIVSYRYLAMRSVGAGYCVVCDAGDVAADAARPELHCHDAGRRARAPAATGVRPFVSTPESGVRGVQADGSEEKGGEVWVFAGPSGGGAGHRRGRLQEL